MFYLGGFQITAINWIGPQAVAVDFVSSDATGCVWQLYANLTLIGSTRRTGERRVVGQLLPSISPAPLLLIRVDGNQSKSDFGSQIPAQRWNRYRLTWSSSGSSNVDRWRVLQSVSAGGSATQVVANVPFTGDGQYSFEFEALPGPGTWSFGVCPVDAGGNAGVLSSTAVVVLLPPDDVTPDPLSGLRFTVACVAGALSVGFVY